MDQPEPHPRPLIKTYWVIPGQFLAGEYPGSLYPETALEKVSKLIACGVNSFLDLTEAGELLPYEPVLRSLTAEILPEPGYRRMAIHDFDIPTRDGMKAILDTIDSALEQGRTLYLHCWAGLGRTGTVVGCYLVRHGLTGPEALAEINRLREVIPPNFRRSSPQTPAQVDMVLNWNKGE